MSVQRPSKRASIIAGVAIAAITMLILELIVGNLVIRWCPRGANCREAGQILFGLGLIVSLAVSAAIGFLVRDLVDRFSAQR